MQIKENIKAPRHWHLCGEFTGHRWIPRKEASNTENVSISLRHHDPFAHRKTHSPPLNTVANGRKFVEHQTLPCSSNIVRENLSLCCMFIPSSLRHQACHWLAPIGMSLTTYQYIIVLFDADIQILEPCQCKDEAKSNCVFSVPDKSSTHNWVKLAVFGIFSRGEYELFYKTYLEKFIDAAWHWGKRLLNWDDTVSWWRHQMGTFSPLLAICAENSPLPGEFPTQRPVTRNFDVSFDLRRNKRLNKQSWGWWFETLLRPLWRQCNVTGLP